MRRTVPTLLALCILYAACDTAEPTPPAPTGPEFGSFGVDLAQMDGSLHPGDDFYRYVNGKWLAGFKIPADKPGYGAFWALDDKSTADVRALLDELGASEQAKGTVQQKVIDLYRSWMDSAAVNARGVQPLQKDLDQIAAVASKADLMRLMAQFDYTSPLLFYVQPHPEEPGINTVFLYQSGLGMPNRDYYLKTGAEYDRYRTAYKTYVTRILELSGDADPAKSADAVIGIEKQIATVHWTPERRRDVKTTNNPVDRAGLAAMIPSIDWDLWLSTAGLGATQRLVVAETTALRDGAKLLDTMPLDSWKKYLAFHLADRYAADLPYAFDDARFALDKELYGVEQREPRWKRGVQLVNGNIGEGVGELYVAQHFPPASKAAMDELVGNLLKAMGQRISTLEWMDDATRAEAQKKLSTFDPMVGYPVKWRDYSKLEITPGTLFENVRAARRFEWQRVAAKVDKPVDRTEWGMTPQQVNAYYDPTVNQIVFPAAILQAPFFDPYADAAVNYGAIGAVIGHEIGHGFDDQGREYDETGKIRNWWTPSTNAKFAEATGRLAKQVDAICPLEGLCINGRLTMGENLGDLGGLEMAYAAYHLSLGGKEAPVLGGFTGDQRFFMAHAQIWRELIREDTQRSWLLIDPHAPGLARATVPERNMDAWYAAFGVTEANKLFIPPALRVHIW